MSGSGAATERLYYTDAYARDFDATIVDRADEGKRVYLDRTAFYPTSGGQLHDLGTLGGVSIVDVVDEGDRVAHLLADPLNGDRASGSIDWARRFDHMQQHTGQHLLSAVFEDVFKAKTVSVHFGDETSTLDVEVDSLSPQTLAHAERRANEIAAENRLVTVSFEDAGTATGLRKAIDRSGTLRIVTIDGTDRSACGGTHVRATGEIGSILLRRMERVRSAIRVEFVCGLRAVALARRDYEALVATAGALSTSIDAVAGLVASQATQLKESDQSRRKLEKELAGYRVAELRAATMESQGVATIVLERAPESMDQLRVMAQAALDLPRTVFVATTATNSVIVAATEDSGVDAGKLLREGLAAAGGKGGGSPRLAQGSAPSAESAAQALTVIRGSPALGR